MLYLYLVLGPFRFRCKSDRNQRCLRVLFKCDVVLDTSILDTAREISLTTIVRIAALVVVFVDLDLDFRNVTGRRIALERPKDVFVDCDVSVQLIMLDQPAQRTP